MRVLVVEDEARLAEMIAGVLRRERYEVDVALDGAAGLDLGSNANYDAIVLDRMLPGLDGLAVCRRLREAGITTPILFLTARRELPERVEGLDAGADDYLGKPFALSELLARVRALTRRADRPLIPSTLRAGDVVVDQRSHRVERAGQELEMSPREYALLEYLLRNAGQVLTREQILDRVWGAEEQPDGNVVDVYIHYLRRKLDEGRSASFIETVRGVGYRVRR